MSFTPKLTYSNNKIQQLPDIPGDELKVSDDFVISFATNGEPRSLYGDPFWSYFAYMGKTCSLRFYADDAVQTSVEYKNGSLVKRLMLFLLYGRTRTIAAGSLVRKQQAFMALARLCNERKILLSDLQRFPNIYMEIAVYTPPSTFKFVLQALNEVAMSTSLIGFSILDYKSIALVKKTHGGYKSSQTPYIPPRIYAHILGRCEQFVEEFKDIEPAILGTMTTLSHKYRKAKNLPNYKGAPPSLSKTALAAALAQVEVFALKWLGAPKKGGEDGELKLRERGWQVSLRTRRISYVLNAARFVTQVLTIAYSGMRFDEARSLTSLSFRKERDGVLGTVNFLQGRTTKTIQDDQALWVVPERMGMVAHAAKFAYKVRQLMSKITRDVAVIVDGESPLWLPAIEPWLAHRHRKHICELLATPRVSMSEWRGKARLLFDEETLQITKSDLATAKLLTPDLNESKFFVGAVWNLAFHQLRRTLVCNAASSGLVSIESLQYQMKHLTRIMTEYYSRRHSYLRLNESMKREFGEAVAESLAIRSAHISDDRFVSPFGAAHKAALIEFVRKQDMQSLLKLAKTGQFTIRENALGLCLHNGVCPYGGYENLVSCVRCHESLLDKNKIHIARAQIASIQDERLSLNESLDVHYIHSLDVQEKALQVFAHVVS